MACSQVEAENTVCSRILWFKEACRGNAAGPQINVEIKNIDPAVVIVKLLVDYEEAGKPCHICCKVTLPYAMSIIDIIDPMEINDGNRLRIIPFPEGGSRSTGHPSRTEYNLTWIEKCISR